MKKSIGIWILVCMLLATGGCAGDITQKEAPSGSGEGTESVAQNTETSMESVESQEEAVRKLTEEELADYTEYINSIENNGFLACLYESPVQLDLVEVFYNGAGLSAPTGVPIEEIRQDYLEASGQQQLETDLIALTTAQIDTFLKEKTGYGFADMEKGMDFIYSEKTDTWYSQHGDTNFCFYDCLDGQETTEGEITLTYQERDGWEPVTEYELVLRREGERLLFVGNRIK